MNDVTVSSKFQVVIPRELRAEMNIRAGQKMRMVRLGNRIEMIPVRTVAEMKGAFPGVTSDGIREEDDRY